MASVSLTLSHLLNMLMPECIDEPCYYEIAPLFFTGFGFSIMNTLAWAVIPQVVDQDRVGLGLGLSMTGANILMSFIPTIGGAFHDHTLDVKHGFFWVNIFPSL